MEPIDTISTSEVDDLVVAFSERFAATAQDPKTFHELLRESFGDSYDHASDRLMSSVLVPTNAEPIIMTV